MHPCHHATFLHPLRPSVTLSTHAQSHCPVTAIYRGYHQSASTIACRQYQLLRPDLMCFSDVCPSVAWILMFWSVPWQGFLCSAIGTSDVLRCRQPGAGSAHRRSEWHEGRQVHGARQEPDQHLLRNVPPYAHRCKPTSLFLSIKFCLLLTGPPGRQCQQEAR